VFLNSEQQKEKKKKAMSSQILIVSWHSPRKSELESNPVKGKDLIEKIRRWLEGLYRELVNNWGLNWGFG